MHTGIYEEKIGDDAVLPTAVCAEALRTDLVKLTSVEIKASI